MTENELHLLDRGCLYWNDRDIVVSDEMVVFMLRDFSGKLVGYQNYRPFAERNHKNVKMARYFTYLPRKVTGYFGLNSLHWTKRVYLVEGVFKATKLHSLGLSAISLMGSETRQHKGQLGLLQRPITAIGDADAAGAKFAQSLGGFQSPVDLDEMTGSEVVNLLKREGVY